MKKHTSTIILLSLTVVLFVNLYFIFKTIVDIKYLSQSIYSQRLELEKKYLKGLSLRYTIRALDDVRKKLNQNSKIILSTEDTLDLITDLEKTAEEFQVRQSINLNEFSSKKRFDSTQININITGYYDQVLSYLTELHRKPYYINFKIIKITTLPPTEGSIKPQISLHLSGLVYWENISSK